VHKNRRPESKRTTLRTPHPSQIHGYATGPSLCTLLLKRPRRHSTTTALRSWKPISISSKALTANHCHTRVNHAPDAHSMRAVDNNLSCESALELGLHGPAIARQFGVGSASQNSFWRWPVATAYKRPLHIQRPFLPLITELAVPLHGTHCPNTSLLHLTFVFLGNC